MKEASKVVGTAAFRASKKVVNSVTPVLMKHAVEPGSKMAKDKAMSFGKDVAGKIKGGAQLGVGVGTLLGASKAVSNVNNYRKETNPNNPSKPSASVFSAEDSQKLIDNAISSCKTVAVTGLENGLAQLKEYGAELKEDGPAALPNIVMRAGLIDSGALVRNVVIDGIGRGTEAALTAVGKAGIDAYRESQTNKTPNTAAMITGFKQQSSNTPTASKGNSSLPVNKSANAGKSQTR